MTDIVERLREEAQDDIESLFYKAADEIERLRNEVSWLRSHPAYGPHDAFNPDGSCAMCSEIYGNSSVEAKHD